MFNIIKMKQPTSLYFAYGANMSKRSMGERCPNAVPVKPFYLVGYRLLFSYHATIESDMGSVVPGCLWKITDDDERVLNGFEGYPTYYNKLYLRQDGDSIMAYQMNPPLNINHRPVAGYVRLLEEGYKDWGLDPQYLDDALYYGIK